MNFSKLRVKLSGLKLLTNLRIPSSPEEKRELVYFILLFFLFSVAAVTSLVNFWWLNSSIDPATVSVMPKMPVGSEINKNISSFTGKYDLFLKYRNESGQLVELAESVGRYPVALLPKPVDQEFFVPEFAPQIEIKALVVMGSGGIATLDIENEIPGAIVRPGTVFGGGKGKITAIDPKGVSWTWSNKKYRTDL